MLCNRFASTRVIASTAVLAGVLMCAATAMGESARRFDERRFIRHTPAGTEAVRTTAPTAIARSIDAAGGAAPSARGGELLWHNYLEWPVYTSSEITIPHGSLIAGTWLNEPKEAQLIALEGDGTPSWVYGGTQVEVAASRNNQVVAALDYDLPHGMVTLYKWHPDSQVPDWSYPITSAAPGSCRAVSVSPDGSIIAVFVTMQDASSCSRLYWFSADSSEPLGTFDGALYSFARNLSLSTTGQYIALMSGAVVYVIDTATGTARYTVMAEGSNDALGISGDGNRLAYGWLSLYVRQWNGSTYELLFTRPGGGDYIRHCAFSANGDTLATAWNPTTHLQNRLELYEPPSSDPLWIYQYIHGSGEYQDVIYNLSITADGSHVAAASWGDQADTNPEIHVFEHDQPEPVYTYNTPGSMFDIDLARADDNLLYLTACGKHVHANEQGHGGDLYAIKLSLAVPGDVNGDGVVDVLDLLAVIADWGPCPAPPAECPADVDGNGVVDVLDLLLVIANWS